MIEGAGSAPARKGGSAIFFNGMKQIRILWLKGLVRLRHKKAAPLHYLNGIKQIRILRGVQILYS